MEHKVITTKSPLSLWRVVLLIVNYIGYMSVYPSILANITLYLNPRATSIPAYLQFFVYSFMILCSFWLAFPLLKEAHVAFRNRHGDFLSIIVKAMGGLFIASMLIGLLISVLTQTETSANQEGIIISVQNNPYLMVFTTLLFAPIVEEVLFRGAFFRSIRPYQNFIMTAMISSVLFGFIHVFDSLIQGNLIDVVYVIQYAIIGLFLSWTYEKTDTIYAPMVLHFFNNALALLLIFI